ncbi:MAG: glycosyltransferase, partial [Candidatus Micrarchaeota archaeon]
MFSFPWIEYGIAFISLYCTVFYSLILFSYKEKMYDAVDLLPRDKLPGVSIVIPVLNEAGVISKTIESVLEMDYPAKKLEIIVVDDGSTDASVAEIQAFAKRGVKLIKNKHTGIGKSSALNAGIRKASGQFIATIDSDSFPEKTSLRQLVSLFPNDDKIMA